MNVELRVTAMGPLTDPAIAVRCDREISATLAELGALGQRLIVDRTPRGISAGGGGLRGSIFSELRGTPARREALIASSVYYAPVVEVGRQPGQRRPPVAAIQLWLTRKLSVPPADVASVAFLVARKIGAAGTTGAHMFEQSMTALRPIAQQRIEQLGARVVAMLNGAS